jgi:hypothetical protein
MIRNSVQTVTTALPVLVPAHGREPFDGWGYFFPADRTETMAVRVVQELDVKARLRTIFQPKELPLFVGAIELKQAYDAKDELALQRATDKVRPWIPHCASLQEIRWESQDGRVSLRTTGQKWNATRWNYSGLMADMFQSARLVIWFSEKDERFLPALYCPDWKTAAFVMTFTGRIRVCPRCSTIFVPSADNVDYCTPAHREAHRVARWRAEKKRRAEEERQKKAAARKSLR